MNLGTPIEIRQAVGKFTGQTLPTLDHLLSFDEQQLATTDIGLMNLLCATDLPGMSDWDIPKYLSKLDSWARRIRYETDRHLYRFQRTPQEFKNSESFFRITMMGTVLFVQFKIHYRPELLGKDRPDLKCAAPQNSRDRFIHGLLGSSRTGTCSSMPVLYVALGQRLGYPLKLARAPGHLFVRWDDPHGNERFNIEATEDTGIACPKDEDYLKKCRENARGLWRESEIDSGYYVGSLNMRETLSTFLSIRGACLYTNRRWLDSLRAYTKAGVFDSRDENATRVGYALTQKLLHEERPPRHFRAMAGDEPNDPRFLLAPEDAACAVFLQTLRREIDGRLPEAIQGFAEACRLDPGNKDYQVARQRVGQKLVQLRPTKTCVEPLLKQGLDAEKCGDYPLAQSCFARAIAHDPKDHAARVYLHRVVRKEILGHVPRPRPDPRAELPALSRAMILHFRGVFFESERCFADARDAYAAAASLVPSDRQHHEAIFRADRKEQERVYRQTHDGAAAGPEWKPRRLKTVQVKFPSGSQFGPVIDHKKED